MPHTVKFFVPLFAITLILSAFLLFSVQPLFGKMVLPLLGGTPGVWNTAMMFFQAMLLGGYAYAHLTTKFLKVRAQAVVHIALLSLCVFVLPVAIPESWANPPTTENPVPWLLGLMLVTIGAPFFVLAGTAPMLQRWFSTTDHPDAQNPYFLYAASNLGSMAALISYPFVVEPLMGLQEQGHIWMLGYIALVALIAGAGFMGCVKRVPPLNDPHLPAKTATPTNRMRLTWLLLAFIPSSLMLGVTTHITTDIAAAPLLWIIPLTLYLLTFIIVFARRQSLQVATAYKWQALAVTIIALFFIRDPFTVRAISVCVHLAAFFLCALTCHLALAQRRPTPQHLTEFYLIMALGGVMGGIFNSLLAPILFTLPLEYCLILCLSMAVPYITGDIPFAVKDIRKDYKLLLLGIGAALAALLVTDSNVLTTAMMATVFLSLTMMKRRSAFIVTLLVIIAINPGYRWKNLSHTLHMERNFFGVIRVVNSEKGGMRMLMHGTTLHGTQALVEKYRLSPISYYASESPGGQVFGMLTKFLGQTPQTVAIVGLGLGSTACFPQVGRDYVFYEIDPAIKRIAEDKNLFTFLSDCGSPYEVVMGDGRLNLAKAADASYDMIFLDAFSSDSIPMHLLTREAVEMYFRKLKPEGLLIVHISNRFMDLSPLVAALGKDAGAKVWFNSNEGKIVAPPDITMQGSQFGIMAKGPGVSRIIDDQFMQWRAYTGTEIRPWTDDYANIFYLMWLKISGLMVLPLK